MAVSIQQNYLLIYLQFFPKSLVHHPIILSIPLNPFEAVSLDIVTSISFRLLHLFDMPIVI